MKTIILLFFLLLPSSLNALADDDNTLVISHIVHPGIQPYKDIMREVYEKLGYKVNFVPIASGRGLKLIEQGLVDADVIRHADVINQYKNTTRLNPPLTTAKLYLVCVKSFSCDKSILRPNGPPIASAIIDKARLLSLNIEANIISNEFYSNILELMELKRYRYSLIPLPDSMLTSIKEKFNTHYINKFDAYHIIGPRLKERKTEIEETLKNVLDAANKK